MKPFSAVHITDLHLADRDFGNHVPGVQEELWQMLEEVADLCIEEQRDLFITGDLFEHKQARLVSHSLVSRLLQYFGRLQEHGVETYLIAGNHDLTADGMNSLSRQPLGVLAVSGFVQFPLVPVRHESGVWITPLHFDRRGEYDPEFYRVPRPEEGAPHIVMAHGSLSSKRHTYNFDHIPYDEVAQDTIDLLLWGHFHEDHGAETTGKTTFVNFGSFCRRSRKQQRPVRIALIDGAEVGGKYKFKVEPYTLTSARPWQGLFNDVVDEYVPLIDPEVTGLAQDLASLYAFEDIDIGELLRSRAESHAVPEEVIERAIHYLDQVA